MSTAPSFIGSSLRRRTAGLVALAALIPLTLAGCSSLGVALGTRMRLNDVPVTALSASLAPSAGLQPGQSAQLVIVATTADGKRFTTVGAGHGKVLFDSFTFTSSVVQVNKDGEVSLPADPRVSEGLLPHVRIETIGHPGVVADLDVPVRHDGLFSARFAGRDGAAGGDGQEGSAGLDGSSGSVDPQHPAPGGMGGAGGNGQHGEDGQAGEPGPAVQVWLTLKTGPRTLLQARVVSGSHQQFYLIDPEGGALAIESQGGAGGAGGAGGRGGRGGQGGTGLPGGSSGSDGLRGLDGRRGREGAAGTIVVTVDPSARPFIDRLHLSNRTGNGQPGPAAEIRFEPVAALW